MSRGSSAEPSSKTSRAPRLCIQRCNIAVGRAADENVARILSIDSGAFAAGAGSALAPEWASPLSNLRPDV
jgi:hypothetical protein